ncbi:MAG: kinase [Terricaulis sp.]
MSAHPIPVLLYNIIQDLRARDPERVPLIGVAGAQGSGKSYQCRILAMTNQPRFAHFSLDDVYWSRAYREELATETHPLFITRGSPGTHQLALAVRTIERIRAASPERPVLLPRFDKATDDAAPDSEWPLYSGPAEAVIVDGWCLGAVPLSPGDLATPVNALERDEDTTGVWRETVEYELRETYQPFFAAFDAIVYLQPPNWEIVRTWRGQQEEQLLARPLTADENAKLDRFLMHYERISRWMMAGHHSAKWIVHLDEARNVTRIEER